MIEMDANDAAASVLCVTPGCPREAESGGRCSKHLPATIRATVRVCVLEDGTLDHSLSDRARSLVPVAVRLERALAERTERRAEAVEALAEFHAALCAVRDEARALVGV